MLTMSLLPSAPRSPAHPVQGEPQQVPGLGTQPLCPFGSCSWKRSQSISPVLTLSFEATGQARELGDQGQDIAVLHPRAKGKYSLECPQSHSGH